MNEMMISIAGMHRVRILLSWQSQEELKPEYKEIHWRAA
jgi:hypothetical protein